MKWFVFLLFLCEIDRQINYYYIGKLSNADQYLAAMGVVNFFTQLIPIGVNFVSYSVLSFYVSNAFKFDLNMIISGYFSS